MPKVKLIRYRHPLTGRFISKSHAKRLGFGKGRARKEILTRERPPSIKELEKAAKKKFTSRQKEFLRDIKLLSQERLEDYQEKSPDVKSYIRWLKKQKYLKPQ